MSHDAHEHDEQPSNLTYLLLPVGGILVGLGVVNLWYSFGAPDVDFDKGLNGNFQVIGSTALDNVGLLPAADYSIVLIVAGLALMVFLNSRAWRYTAGY